MVDQALDSQAEVEESRPRQFEYKLKLARFILTSYIALPLIFVQESSGLSSQLLLTGLVTYLLIALVVTFSPFIANGLTRSITLCADGLALGIVSWLTQSVVYGIESMGFLVICATITTRFRSLSTAIIFAALGAAGTWYFSPDYSLPVIIRWEYNLPAMVCSGLMVAYAVLFLHQHAQKITRTKDEYSELERKHLELKFQLYQVSKYMSPSLRKKLSRPRDIQPGTVRKRLTIFFSDLVGFTKMSENMDPKDLNFVLNSYVNEMSKVAIEYGATIDKFMGDGMMAFFGDPQSKGTKEDAVQCVAMALEMQRRMPKLRAKWREQGIDADLHIRMGINSGFTTVGNFGSNNRLDYTALGAEVNLASRLESNAKTDSIYISSATNLLIGDKFMTDSVGNISVKGFSEPVSVYQVLGPRNAASQERRYSNLNIDGFSLYLDLDSMPNYNQKKAYEALVEAASKVKKFQDK